MTWLTEIGRTTLDVLLPAQCFCCGEQVADPARLCQTCFAETRFITEPHCSQCGLPFEFEAEPGRLCGACAALPPAFDCARAAVHYAEPLRSALLRFKHGDRLDMAPGLANLLLRAGQGILPTAEILAPVPLHRRRLWQRRYNQSSAVSQLMAEHLGVKGIPDLLVRTRHTRSQGGLSATARRRNVRGVFAVNEIWREALQQRHIVLIDDVYTTGATVEACARILKRAGAQSVSILVIARVVRSTPTG